VLRELGRDDEALGAYRRCLYLDPGLAVGHLALADALLRRGQPTRAARELEVAGRLAAGHPSGDPVPEGDGLTWGRLAELVAARSRLAA
jgi:chemotaxis protein methyltransferase CheR